MPSKDDDYKLYERISNVPGWLNLVTAHRTIDILRWQLGNGITGSLMEIGIYCGRYFSILLNNAKASGSPVLGMDTFQFVSETRVLSEIAGIFGDKIGDVRLWKGDSSRIGAAKIIAEIGNPRFVSVDGAHDYENVFRDLVLADEIISADGLVAADDALNPMTLGVNQAVNVFLSTPRNLVPVAYVSNKLFMAHRSRAADYRLAFEVAISGGDEPES
jgi:hypothetical protein